MSIATEIQRLNTAKADLKAAINLLKGSAVITDETIDEYASAMAGLPLPAVEEEFVSKTCPHNGPAKLLKVYGKSVVNNQLLQNGDFSDGDTGWTPYRATMSVSGGIATITPTVGDNSSGAVSPLTSQKWVSGHKYFVKATAKGEVGTRLFFGAYYIPLPDNGAKDSTGAWMDLVTLFEATDAMAAVTGLRLGVAQFATADLTPYQSKGVFCVDLTLRFGAGNEPTSVDEALRLLGGDAFDPTYDAGSLQSNKTSLLRAERIPVINVWDEEWENGYIKEDGTEIYSPIHIKSAHLIPILPATKYWFKKPARIVQRQAYYDANGDFLSFVDLYATSGSGGQFTTPSNAHYLKFYLSQNPYAGDVCINLFDPAINGQYFPHWRGKLTLNLSTLTGKLNGEGASVVVFPDGLRGVGTDRDTAYGSTGVVRRAVVDLGGLTWYYTTSSSLGAHFYAILSPAAKNDNRGVLPLCAKYQGVTALSRYYIVEDKVIAIEDGNRVRIWDSAYTDLATFKAAMSGVMLDYPLATPLTYTLDTPLPTDLTCEQNDILQRVSDNNCPFVGDIEYKL